MKAISLLLAGCLFMGTGCNSSKQTSATTESKGAAIDITPPLSQSEFLTRYPTATTIEWARYNDATVPIDWELTGWPVLTTDDYMVTYNMDNRKYYSWYDAGGNWIGSTYVVSNFDQLPAPVRTMISSKYAGYTIMHVNSEMWKDQMAYEVELRSSTTKVKMVVDANGKILKEKVKTL